MLLSLLLCLIASALRGHPNQRWYRTGGGAYCAIRPMNAKSGTQIAMAALCAALLAVAVMSFVAVRRAQRREEAERCPQPSELENLKDS